MILVNAIYFKGVWNDTFDREETRMHSFHRSENDSFTVPFMKKEEYMLAGEDETLRLTWVELPYEVLCHTKLSVHCSVNIYRV